MQDRGKISFINLLIAAGVFILGFIPFYSYFTTNYAVFKYGPSASPFYSRLLKYLKIKGRIVSRANNLPIGGLKVALCDKGIETITNKNGYFWFEIFDTKETEFKIEVLTDAQKGENNEYIVKFKAFTENNININQIRSQETTIEILL